jgi:hypothetical protein
LPIGTLAYIGCGKEALRHANRFLRRLFGRDVVATVRMAGLAAEICLEAGDLARMEHYLAIAESTERFNTRKCDKGFSVNWVREFRGQKGLLDPDDAINDEQRNKARFQMAARQYRQALAKGDRETAKVAVAEMERILPDVQPDWLRGFYVQQVVDCFVKLNDSRAVKRCLRGLSEAERDDIFSVDKLADLGLKAEALTRARRDIAQTLQRLRDQSDPNINDPVNLICRSVTFLVKRGEKQEARRWLRRALKELPRWPVIKNSWSSSAMYRSLAEAMATIDGPAAAEELLQRAVADAMSEKRGGFRQAAVGGLLGLKADDGRLDESIEEARKLRSPRERRKTLAPLLAKARRWGELRVVLCQVQSPEEAVELAWSIKFQLPGGAAKR